MYYFTQFWVVYHGMINNQTTGGYSFGMKMKKNWHNCLLAVEDKIKFCLELLKMVVSGFIFQILLVTLTDNNVL